MRARRWNLFSFSRVVRVLLRGLSSRMLLRHINRRQRNVVTARDAELPGDDRRAVRTFYVIPNARAWTVNGDVAFAVAVEISLQRFVAARAELRGGKSLCRALQIPSAD